MKLIITIITKQHFHFEEAEKIKLCEIVIEAKADFIKTSTGFSKARATHEDVKLLRKYISKDVKAAGGISDLKDAEIYINEGATRLGTSRIVKLSKSLEK